LRRAVVVLVLVAASAAAAAAGGPAPAQTPEPLVIALNLPSDGFQVGAVQGTRVILARGLEVDLARALAARLDVRRVTFYQESRFPRLVAPGPKPWDLALAQIVPTAARRKNVDFSVPYLPADQGVLLRRGLSRPRTIAALRRLRLCSRRGSEGAATVVGRIHPARRPLLYPSLALVVQNLRSGRCDAAVQDAPLLGAVRAQWPARYGPLVGAIRTGQRYAIALPQGSPLAADVNAVLRGLLADGSVRRLSRRWLTADLASLAVLR
jgi:ABC-type amino acid transport substrate-binding protein